MRDVKSQLATFFDDESAHLSRPVYIVIRDCDPVASGRQAMRPSPVPSRDVLRFLRSQHDTLFLTTPTTVICRSSAAQPVHSTTCCRTYTTSPSRQGSRQNNVLDDLWPRQRDTCKALPPPHSPPQPSHARHASHAAHSSWWRRIFTARQRSQKNKHKSDGNHTVPFDNASYEDTSAQLFNLSRALSRNPSGADLKLRCTEFDANGSVTLVAGEFKKSELIAKYGLLPRDLRKIDSSVLPHILVRPSAILINLLHLRVLIQSDRVLVFDAYGSTDSYTQSLFMYDLEGKLRQKADPRAPSGAGATTTYLPYEFRALEAVLISATGGLEAEFALVRDPVTHILRELEEDIDREKLRHLLIHSKKLGTFEQKARLVRDAIDDLLNADDDLAAMYLTERQTQGHAREENDHQEVEMLLESYHKICDEIVEISGNLISNIRNTEEVVKAILDANRNQLMLLEIKFSIGTLGLAGGTLIAGLYGMNLNNFIEETDWGFGGVTFVCFGLSAVIAIYGMRKLRKVQKVRMWGEGGLDYSHGPASERSASGGRFPFHRYGQLGNGGNGGGGAGSGAATGGGGLFRGAWSRGNWRSEALESAAVRQARVNERERVLWPGMEGLGMHRLSEAGEEVRPEEPEREEVGVMKAENGAAAAAGQGKGQKEKAVKEAGPLWRKK